MATPNGAVEVGSNAYLFKSPASEMKDCFIVAHGGQIDLTQKFDVPQGQEVVFLASHGQKVKGDGPLGLYNMWAKRSVSPIENDNQVRALDAVQRYAHGRPCPDYILAKAMGEHWEDPANRGTYDQVLQNYTGTYLKMGKVLLYPCVRPGGGRNWVPHFVTIRNRTSIFHSKNIWLSAVIAELNAVAAKQGLVFERFYCGHCRDDDSSRANALRRTAGRAKLGSTTGR